MVKENLVLVHSFPTNSVLLSGLSEFLGDYFNVYFVDLPGFNSNVKPLKENSIENFSKFVDKRIEELNLNSYFIGGVSFGFIVVNGCNVGSNCKGFLAMEPYLNIQSLNDGFLSLQIKKMLSFLILKLGLVDNVYNSNWFHCYLCKHQPKGRIDTLLRTVDSKTFFEVLNIILNYTKEPIFQNKPYILAINPKDDVLKTDKITEIFSKIPQKLIVRIDSAHHPKDPSKAYFKKSVREETITSILKFFQSM